MRTKGKKSKRTYPAFLDMKGHDDPSKIELMEIRLKGNPEYVGRRGTRLHFEFKTKENLDYFMISTLATLRHEGYRAEITEEVDPFEREQPKVSSFKDGINKLRRASAKH